MHTDHLFLLFFCLFLLLSSPEACAAILWKSAKASPKVSKFLYIQALVSSFKGLLALVEILFYCNLQAAEKLKITASELCKLQIADGIIPVMMLSFTYNVIACSFRSLSFSFVYPILNILRPFVSS